MLTSRPLSTISWNSKIFLLTKLEELALTDKIRHYACIYHKAEEDENKDHWHVYIEPNGRINDKVIWDSLIEYDLNNVKPIKPHDIRTSKFEDWFLYSKHDINYLKSKGIVRKYHYQNAEFITNDDIWLDESIKHIDMSKYNRVEILKNAIENKTSFEQLVANGQIPLNLLNQYKMAYDIVNNLNNTVKGYSEISQNTFVYPNSNDIEYAVIKEVHIPGQPHNYEEVIKVFSDEDQATKYANYLNMDLPTYENRIAFSVQSQFKVTADEVIEEQEDLPF